MPTFTCESCGTEFDPDREGAYKHANTYRCPSCGAVHEGAKAYLERKDDDGNGSDNGDGDGGSAGGSPGGNGHTNGPGPTVTRAEAIETADGLRLTIDVELGGSA